MHQGHLWEFEANLREETFTLFFQAKRARKQQDLFAYPQITKENEKQPKLAAN